MSFKPLDVSVNCDIMICMSNIESLQALFKTLSDTTRLRIISVLDAAELTVSELTQTLMLGQSTLSNQLIAMRKTNILQMRKEGQKVYYSLSPETHRTGIRNILKQALEEAKDSAWYEKDRRQLELTLEERKKESLAFFNAGGLDVYPGDTWESLACGLISLMKGMSVIDMGCGLGRLAAMFAEAGNRVYAIDNSERQIESARKLYGDMGGRLNFEFKEVENTGYSEGSFDLAVMSQTLHHTAAPQKAIDEAYRLLKKGGKLLLFDLAKHNDETMKSRFGDFWLGFSPEEVERLLMGSGFAEINISIKATDMKHKDMETLTAVAVKD